MRFIPLPSVLVAGVLAAAAAGCGDDDKARCDDDTGGAPIDQEATAADGVVALPAGGPFELAVGAIHSIQALAGGQAIFTPENAACFPSAATPCRITLQRLRFDLGDFQIELSDGKTLTVTGTTVSLHAPVELQSAGAGYLMPAGLTYRTRATVNGVEQATSAPTPAPAAASTLDVAVLTQDFVTHVTFPVALRDDAADCSPLLLSATVNAPGERPWTQEPPL